MILPGDVLPTWAWYVIAGVWGAIWGSFGNVVIHRLPEGMSVVRPASHCPSCKKPIRGYDNIPVLSWLLLRGRCRHCGVRIPVRYTLVEAASAALAVMTMYSVLGQRIEGLPLFLSSFLVYFAFLWALLVLSVIDLKTMLLPDAITLPGIVVGLTFTLVANRDQALPNGLAVIGSYLTVWIFFVLGYRLLTKREGMGMGDAKLLAMIGALLGWKGALFALVGGALQGLLINLPFLLRRQINEAQESSDETQTSEGEEDDTDAREQDDEAMSVLRSQVPFGPMLSLAALEYFFWGEEVIAWYFSVVDGLVARFIL